MNRKSIYSALVERSMTIGFVHKIFVWNVTYQNPDLFPVKQKDVDNIRLRFIYQISCFYQTSFSFQFSFSMNFIFIRFHDMQIHFLGVGDFNARKRTIHDCWTAASRHLQRRAAFSLKKKLPRHKRSPTNQRFSLKALDTPVVLLYSNHFRELLGDANDAEIRQSLVLLHVWSYRFFSSLSQLLNQCFEVNQKSIRCALSEMKSCIFNSTHWEVPAESGWFKPNFDCNYTFQQEFIFSMSNNNSNLVWI